MSDDERESVSFSSQVFTDLNLPSSPSLHRQRESRNYHYAAHAQRGINTNRLQVQDHSPSSSLHERRSANQTVFDETDVESISVGTDDSRNSAQSANDNGYLIWRLYTYLVTCMIPSVVLRKSGLVHESQRRAWREKIALCSIILLLSITIGFFTFGFRNVLCSNAEHRIHYKMVPHDSMIIHGGLFNLSTISHVSPAGSEYRQSILTKSSHIGGTDGSFLFQNVNNNCKQLIFPPSNTSLPMVGDDAPYYFPCKTLDNNGQLQELPNIYRSDAISTVTGKPLRPHPFELFGQVIKNPYYGCHLSLESRQKFYAMKRYADVYYRWSDLEENQHLKVLFGNVIDVSRINILTAMGWNVQKPLLSLMNIESPVDQSISMRQSKEWKLAGKCAMEIAKVGVIDTESVGCLVSHLMLICSLVFVLSVVFIKFLLAVAYEWRCRGKEHEMKNGDNSKSPIICLLTCYSEGRSGLHISLNSIAKSQYEPKIIIAICDGAVESKEAETVAESANSTRRHSIASPPPRSPLSGEPTNSKNSLSQNCAPARRSTVVQDSARIPKQDTWQHVVGMMQEVQDPLTAPHFSYISVAKGELRHNKAQIFTGYYSTEDGEEKVPMICIVKRGYKEEKWRNMKKSGNRGKRDSQVILMSFFQKVFFDERMTDLENELYCAIQSVSKRRPFEFEAILMVDADTELEPYSIAHLVNKLESDTNIMGVCGETKIGNKRQSWVTAIQVFEYFISHHLTKSFESLFGIVTCLPGCFCMYRIKAPKGDPGYYVPILAHPDIVVRYSTNTVDTLHLKNLLLLGEDRYLTTLMLKTFPSRSQVFVPHAICKTQVPATFKALLDQRRRWINSTVHNLFELVLVPELCGVFCCSMRFVVGIELVGTFTLPAALGFTVYLLGTSVWNWAHHLPLPVIPLIMLSAILGLPGVLIVITVHDIQHVGWMLIYLLSLPIWNFLLPLNAYWKFDDFSWRQEEQSNSRDGEKEKPFDATKIRMLHHSDYLAMKADEERYYRGKISSPIGSRSSKIPSTIPPVPPLAHRKEGSLNEL